METMELTKNHPYYGECNVTVKPNWGGDYLCTITLKNPLDFIKGLIVLKGDVGKYITIQTQRVNGRWFEANMPANSFNNESGLTPWNVIDFIYKGTLTVKGLDNLEQIFKTNVLEKAVCATKEVLIGLEKQYNEASSESNFLDMCVRNRLMAL